MTADAVKTKGSFRGFMSVFLCCLAAVFEGFDLQVPGVSAPLVSSVFSMDSIDTGYFLSLSTFGMLFGALIGGRLSDHIGRKWVLIGSIVIYSVFTLLTVFSTSIEMLFWLRFLTGLGLGGALPNMFALGVESVEPGKRSTAVGLILAGPGVGGALVSAIAGMTATPEQWTVIYYVGGIAPLLTVVPLLIFFLPDRPEETAIENANASDKQDINKAMPGIMETLFGEGRAIRTLAVWTGLLSILLVLFVLLSWLPTLLVDKGLSIAEASIIQIGINLSAIPGSILAGVILDYLLKRNLIALLSVIFIAAIGGIILLATGPVSVGVMFLGATLAGVTVIGGQTMLYALAPVCYPQKGRGTGVGFSVAVGRFGSAGGPLITGYLVAFGMTSAQVLLSLIPIAGLAGVMTLFIAGSVRKEQDSK
ncbi:MAG: MFS transporter [Gammaproteobacteria bacterium]|jgi:AAHS family 3-hydroxyphenylpropionic acid transporter|nr:MFS transporter [Gammaproteobacteria bacterium]MBT6043914.1 MFS transporter [Gammaproteobacteria bacterium]